MCGLVGIVPRDALDGGALQRASDALRHRGPDGHGWAMVEQNGSLRVFQGDDVATGRIPTRAAVAHRRLAILDVSENANQPIESDGVALVYNGEIYNYADLRAELEAMGHAFSSSGDTEVVLKAYLAWGTDCFRRFAGMWALAILDTKTQRLILSRDRFGIKPLFWTRHQEGLVFASELKALMSWPAASRNPNVEVVAGYTCLSMAEFSGNTWFNDIHSFPAAAWGEVDLTAGPNAPDVHRYWSLQVSGDLNSLETAARDVRSMLERSVKEHLASDVPSGTCLSGGLDSTSITALATGHDSATYTHKAIGFVADDPRVSEEEYMDVAEASTGASLRKIRVSNDQVLDALPRIIAMHDQPFGSISAVAQWFVFEAACKDGLRVMLDGQGADEMFGGYEGYILNRARADLLAGRWRSFLNTRRTWNQSKGSFPVSVYRTIGDAFFPAFRGARGFTRLGNLSTYVSPAVRDAARALRNRDTTPRHRLTDILAKDLLDHNLPALLRYEDTNAMAHSIEARVPFLDHRLVEFSFRLTEDMKVDGMARKIVLARAMADEIPSRICARTDKVGFTGNADWLKNIIRKFGPSLAETRTDAERQLLDTEKTKRLFEADDLNVHLSDSELWRLINMKLWCRRHAGEALL